MKLTKQLEAEILKVYNAYWKGYLKGDVKSMSSLLVDDYTQVGSAETEVFNNKKAAVKFLNDTIDQVAGKAEMRHRSTRIEQQGNLVLVHELCDVYVQADAEWMFYAKFRASTLMQEKKHGWRIVHQHSSFPDARTGDGENIATQKIAAENQQLREAIKRRTVELESKNRELEIETALEKVRAIAMGMKEPADMLEVCEAISLQMQSLDVKEIRNVQTAIFYENRGTYMNYEYYTRHKKAIVTETTYTNHRVHKAFATKMLKGKGEVFVTHIKGKKVKDWIAYQKTTNVFIDRFLEKATSLNYYWHSLGPVALGISTYVPLSKEESGLFKRFLNVFELAYTRYLDIEQALAQAREAQIEAALERVRARGMAMYKSEELADVIGLLQKELTKLEFTLNNCILWIMNEKPAEAIWWVAPVSNTTLPVSYKIVFPSLPYFKSVLKAWKERKSQWVYALKGRDKRATDNYLFNDTPLSVMPAKVKKAFHKTEMVHISFSFYNYGGLHISTPRLLTEEQLDIINRFSKVFDQTYRRFLDLQKAEAQAREAQIEASLERVRARTMAMQQSAELPETSFLLFQQLKGLGELAEQLSIGIVKEDEHIVELSATVHGSPLLTTFRIPIDEQYVMRNMVTAWRAGKKTLVLELRGRDLIGYNNWRNEFLGQKLFTYSGPDDCWIINVAFFSKGLLSFSSNKPQTEETLQLLERFAGVVEQTYSRFLDLQRAEAQARESQIQLALERVRARTMAMQHSDELKHAAALLFQQVKSLGVPAYSCGYSIWEKDEKEFTSWMSTQDGSDFNSVLNIPLTEDANFIRFAESREKGEQFVVLELRGKRMQEHYQYLKTIPAFKAYFDYAVSVGFDLPETQIHHLANCSQGNLLFITLEPCPEFHDVFKRFAAVFDQTYTRFLDLRKAEAQARESQIQLALERVRARTMAMQKSDELQDAAIVLFQQIKSLGVQTGSCGFNIWNKKETTATVWMSSAEGELQAPFDMPLTESPIYRPVGAAMKRGDDFLVKEVEGKNLVKHFDYLSTLPGIGDTIKDLRKTGYVFPERMVYHFAFFKNGYLSFHTHQAYPEAHDIFKRFAKIFEQTYTRFLDLQKAETQSRESQIEAALERVRSRTMGMQKSEELKEVIQVVYEQFVQLKIHIEHTGFIMDYKSNDDMHIWLADQHRVPSRVTIPYFDSAHWNSFKEAKEKGTEFFANKLSFEEKNRFYQDLFRVIPGVTEETLEFYLRCHGLAISTVLLENVGLYIENFSGIPYTDEENSTLMRFGRVFQQTYTRFLDLQKAEAQAREAQIEAALEKVRGKAMAMHSSSDLSTAASTVFTELRKLGIHPIRSGVGLTTKEPFKVLLYAATASADRDDLSLMGQIDMASHPCLKLQYESCIKKENYFPVLAGEDLKEYYKSLSTQIAVPSLTEGQIRIGHYGYYFPLADGYFFAWTGGQPFSENEVDILIRFKAIIDLTFRRYLELRRAEAQAREALIETSLERVRSRTLAMQKSDELAETAAVLFKQLITLGVAPNRLYIAIIKNEGGDVEFWITDEDGSKVSSAFTANLQKNRTWKKMYEGWRNGEKSITIDMQGEELHEYFRHLGSLNVPFKGGLSQTRRVQSVAYFSHGFVGIASPGEQADETTSLLERFAAVFNLTFTRFNDLKLAEAQAHQAHLDLIQLQTEKRRAEDALTELSATQAQLVQQEKLASLGQLTAGIAHEIKNPLNFVNNFSSVSVELVDEAMEEIKKLSGGDGDVRPLLDNVKKNLNKIIEHGTRADGIVKSMLQHSRGGSGKKEPLDLNALVREYVNLAFHGMRAAKNPINVDITLDLDQSVDKVSIIAEDFSRVIINLCQNAFDAMREKTNARGKSYLPKLTVRTVREADRVVLEIGDNGPGIPDAIKDNILQPFFTTKKGTQGTGLGLSITHDIVKAHGASLSIESCETVGTTFKVFIPLQPGR